MVPHVAPRCRYYQPAAPTDRATVYKLYVKLSASQTRKRLQRTGLGVRKVAATDRNQSVILHTATGRHLRDLQALFSDLTNSLGYQALDNTGRKPGRHQRRVAARRQHSTRAALASCGPTKAYQRIQQKPRSSVNPSLLWALAGAFRACTARDLDEPAGQRLLEALD